MTRSDAEFLLKSEPITPAYRRQLRRALAARDPDRALRRLGPAGRLAGGMASLTRGMAPRLRRQLVQEGTVPAQSVADLVGLLNSPHVQVIVERTGLGLYPAERLQDVYGVKTVE